MTRLTKKQIEDKLSYYYAIRDSETKNWKRKRIQKSIDIWTERYAKYYL